MMKTQMTNRLPFGMELKSPQVAKMKSPIPALSNDERYFAAQIQAAHQNYELTGDWRAYIGDCLKVAVQVYATEKQTPLSTIDAGMRTPVFRGAVASVADTLTCPVDAEHSAQSFLIALGCRVRGRADQRMAPIKQVLEKLGISC
jgi:hypothetical protein